MTNAPSQRSVLHNVTSSFFLSSLTIQCNLRNSRLRVYLRWPGPSGPSPMFIVAHILLESLTLIITLGQANVQPCWTRFLIMQKEILGFPFQPARPDVQGTGYEGRLALTKGDHRWSQLQNPWCQLSFSLSFIQFWTRPLCFLGLTVLMQTQTVITDNATFARWLNIMWNPWYFEHKCKHTTWIDVSKANTQKHQQIPSVCWCFFTAWSDTSH